MRLDALKSHLKVDTKLRGLWASWKHEAIEQQQFEITEGAIAEEELIPSQARPLSAHLHATAGRTQTAISHHMSRSRG